MSLRRFPRSFFNDISLLNPRRPHSPRSYLTRRHFTHSFTMATWQRLIRFVDDNGNETFGEPLVSSESELESKLASNDLYATEYRGQSPVGELEKGEKVHVKSLSSLLKPADVPIIRCIGLNYIKHSKYFFGHAVVSNGLTIASQGGWSHPSPISITLH
jgi:hypothetical protein